MTKQIKTARLNHEDLVNYTLKWWADQQSEEVPDEVRRVYGDDALKVLYGYSIDAHAFLRKEAIKALTNFYFPSTSD